MEYHLRKEGKFEYIQEGEGRPLILLHGLMGALSNFQGIIDHFSKNGYEVVIPNLPIYSLPILNTNVKSIASFTRKFLAHKGYKDYFLLGNSLGGHVGLVHALKHHENMAGLILTGSSGLYEKAFGDTFPRREDKEYLRVKTQEVFYDPAVATDELVDDIFVTVNDRNKLIRILSIAKSAIRHNMSNDLKDIPVPTLLIWGKQDGVTPPEVAEEFHEKLPHSELHWIDKCGHAPMMEHPGHFNEILGDWLNRH
jgi:pimeloyl-ACP methyl ester carboxylesterase